MKIYTFLLLLALTLPLSANSIKEEHQISFKEKIKQLKSLANSNNKNAQFLLGVLTLKENPNESMIWLKKAAENNCPAASGILGLQLFENKKQKQGFNQILKAAEEGDIISQMTIANFYQAGNYIQQNDIKAFSWFFQVNSYKPLVSLQLSNMEGEMSKNNINIAKELALKRIKKLGSIPKEACYSNVFK